MNAIVSLQPSKSAVADESMVSAGVSIFSAPNISTASLNINGTQTVNILEPANKPNEIATLQ